MKEVIENIEQPLIKENIYPINQVEFANEHGIIGVINEKFSTEDIENEPEVRGPVTSIMNDLGPIGKAVLNIAPEKFKTDQYYMFVRREHREPSHEAGHWHFDGNFSLKKDRVGIDSGDRMLCAFGDVANTEVLDHPITLDLGQALNTNNAELDMATIDLVDEKVTADVRGGESSYTTMPNNTLFSLNLNTIHRRGPSSKDGGVRLLVAFGPMPKDANTVQKDIESNRNQLDSTINSEKPQ